MQVTIERLDYYGRGVAHLDSKVIFVENALPKEIVEIKIIKEHKHYEEAVVLKYIKKSSQRIESLCPYFNICGGCQLLNLSYEDTLNFKLKKTKENLMKNKINFDKISIIKNDNPYNYRNKVSLKIVNERLGYFKENTHELVSIDNCLIARKEINEVIKNYQLLNIQNGTLTIRCNSNKEVLLIIESDNKNYDIDIIKLKKLVKLVGIVYNDKAIYGNNFFYERISGYLFKVSYNSFFQVNHNIVTILFELVQKTIEEDTAVLDLYCGVGTLSIVASLKAKEVYGIEIIPNAIINANKNMVLNKRDNLKFMLGRVDKVINKLTKTFDTVIVDPPRSGLDKNTINYLNNLNPKKIIYISCDLSSLMRDLKLLTGYEIKECKILDMFSYTYHLESFVVLERKN